MPQQGTEISRQDTGLLLLFACIHLNEELQFAILPFHFLGQDLRDLGPVDRMDHIEQRHGVARLVRLQRTDQMQFDSGIADLQVRPFTLRFLDAVLAEHPLPGVQHGYNVRRRRKSC